MTPYSKPLLVKRFVGPFGSLTQDIATAVCNGNTSACLMYDVLIQENAQQMK